jgi:ribosomal protein L11 methylase PrmA
LRQVQAGRSCYDGRGIGSLALALARIGCGTAIGDADRIALSLHLHGTELNGISAGLRRWRKGDGVCRQVTEG